MTYTAKCDGAEMEFLSLREAVAWLTHMWRALGKGRQATVVNGEERVLYLAANGKELDR